MNRSYVIETLDLSRVDMVVNVPRWSRILHIARGRKSGDVACIAIMGPLDAARIDCRFIVRGPGRADFPLAPDFLYAGTIETPGWPLAHVFYESGKLI